MRNGILPGIVVLVATVAGCGGGGTDPTQIPAALQALADCTSLNVGSFGMLVERLQDVFEGAVNTGSPPAGITYTPSGPNGYTFTATFDLDDNGSFETNGTGSIQFTADPSDGILPGDSAIVQLDFDGAPGTGSMQLTMILNANLTINLNGAGQITDAAGCQFGIVNMALNVNPLAAGSFPTGTISFNATEPGGESFQGSITLDGTAVASGTGDFSAGGSFDFDVNLETGEFTFA